MSTTWGAAAGARRPTGSVGNAPGRAQRRASSSTIEYRNNALGLVRPEARAHCGLVRADYEDFVVDEVPLYPRDDGATYGCFGVQKAGVSAMNAVNDTARALHVRRRDVRPASLEEACALTQPWFARELASLTPPD